MIKDQAILIIESQPHIYNELQRVKPVCLVHRELIVSFHALRQINPEKLKSYFAVLADFSLPDAAQGEHIQYLSQMGLPVIVMNQGFGLQIRNAIFSSGAVDYVHKSDLFAIEQIRSIFDGLRFLKDKEALVVNDSKMQTFILKKMLSALRLKVFTCGNGATALQSLAQNEKIVLVLSDYILPEMDGLEFIYRVRQNFPQRQMILLAMTGTISDDLFARVFKAGADDVLTKPFKQEELNKRIFREVEILSLRMKVRKLSHQLRQINLNQK